MVAAICRRMGWSPSANVAAHREHQPDAKTDPLGIDMTAFRRRVAELLKNGDDDVSVADVVVGIHSALGQAATRSTPTGRQIDDMFRDIIGRHNAVINAKIDLLASKVDIDAAELAAIGGTVKASLADLIRGDESNPNSDEQVAKVLKSLLGERAAAVGRVLVGE